MVFSGTHKVINVLCSLSLMKGYSLGSLRVWFVAHGVVDLLVAVPLFLFPVSTAALFSLDAEPLLPRLVAAALVAIGVSSFFAGKEDSLRALLLLKIVWASVALLALFLALPENLLLLIPIAPFLLFLLVWIFYSLKEKGL